MLGEGIQIGGIRIGTVVGIGIGSIPHPHPTPPTYSSARVAEASKNAISNLCHNNYIVWGGEWE